MRLICRHRPSSSARPSDDAGVAPMNLATMAALPWRAAASDIAFAITADFPEPDSPHTASGCGSVLSR